jgi:hypothetical protein
VLAHYTMQSIAAQTVDVYHALKSSHTRLLEA